MSLSCPGCGGSRWTNLDHLRTVKYWWDRDRLEYPKPVGFVVCEVCGYLTYDHFESEAKVKDFYGTAYRKIVQGMNVVTCNRKDAMHRAFMDGEFKTWAKEGRRLADIGCAQGSMLNMLAARYGWAKEKLFGTEWTKGFAAYGRSEYGLTIEDELPKGEKFDVITMYRVLEHVWAPDKKLAEIRDALNDDGLFYCSVPVWLDLLEDPPGGLSVDFENIFHLNHCQVYSKASIRNLLAAAGFKLLKENWSMYGFTFLAAKGSMPKVQPDDPARVAEIVRSQKKAVELAASRMPAEATAVWPKYPDAWILHALHAENMRDEDIHLAIVARALELMPDNPKLWTQKGMSFLHWNGVKSGDADGLMTNRILQAEKAFLKSVELKPGHEDVYVTLGIIEYVHKGRVEEAVSWWRRALEVNPSRFLEIMNYVGHARAGAKIPAGKPEEIQRPKDTGVVVAARPGMEMLAHGLGAPLAR